MAERNHMADKLNSDQAETEGHKEVDTSPTAFSKYAFVIFVALLLTFFIGLYIYRHLG